MSQAHVDLGRLGGLTRAALYGGREVTQKARDTFRASFLAGHGCKVCPRIDLPPELPAAERQRRADALYAAHYQRIRLVRSAKQRARRAERTNTPEAA